MKIHAFRLTRGDDLKASLEKYASENNLSAACLLSSVGCVSRMNIRLADGVNHLKYLGDFEIIVCNGTIAAGEAHLHICFSDTKGNLIGGHLCDGCIINTTCEIVMLEMTDYEFKREFDKATGYDELLIERVCPHS